MGPNRSRANSEQGSSTPPGDSPAAPHALLAAGASVNVRDENGCTALAMACFSQQQVTAKMLIDANAMIDSQDVLGLTALMVSALSGATSMVRLLLIAGADTQLRDAASRTAYDYAQINGHLAARKLLRAQRLGRARAGQRAVDVKVLALELALEVSLVMLWRSGYTSTSNDWR